MNHELIFEWNAGSAADNMARTFRALDIPYEHTSSGMRAAIGQDSELTPVEYYRIAGNIYGITKRPVRTSDYFNLSPETLLKVNRDGYTKEECLLLDKNPDARPFCYTLLDALEKAARYAEIGYDDIHILERINNKYAVIANG